MREIAEELELNRDISYNKQITVSLFDKDLSNMAVKFNQNLEYQQDLKYEAEKSRNQLKQSISDIAHDLRTPITVIKGNLQRLQQTTELAEDAEEFVKICQNKTELLKQMVDEFFELSYFESENTKVNLETVDITNYAVQFLIEQETLIRENQFEPDINIPEKSLFINADVALLERIFSNLLNNIMKHSHKIFSFEMEEKQKEIKIRFKNEIVLQEKYNNLDVEHLFERTYRGDEARTGGGPGGLGLYIVKLLVEKQGATVRAFCQEDEDKTYLVMEMIWNAVNENLT